MCTRERLRSMEHVDFSIHRASLIYHRLTTTLSFLSVVLYALFVESYDTKFIVSVSEYTSV